MPTPGRIADSGVHPLAGLRVGIALGRGRAADRERAVIAGAIAVEGVDDVEEGLVAGPDDPVGEVVRVRVAALAGDRVDRLDLIRPQLVEPLVGQRDDLVLADPGLEHVHDVLVDTVDHRRRLGQQHDLVRRLDQPRVEHCCWRVDRHEALALHLEQERRLDDVDPDRPSATPASSSRPLISPTADSIRPADGATAPRSPSIPARQFSSASQGKEPVVPCGRTEVPDHRLPAACEQGVAGHLVAEGAADPGLRGVADVVEVEEQEGAALAGVSAGRARSSRYSRSRAKSTRSS